MRGVTVEPGLTGAGLRISGGHVRDGLSGTAEWQAGTYEFQVENAGEVEFVCELRAIAGEAWFNADQLRVVPTD